MCSLLPWSVSLKGLRSKISGGDGDFNTTRSPAFSGSSGERRRPSQWQFVLVTTTGKSHEQIGVDGCLPPSNMVAGSS